MKNLFLSLALIFGFMSFSNISANNLQQIQTCCTATYVVEGEPVASATACVKGVGPETSALACEIAKAEVKRQLSLTSN